jgi:signal transduction histidine kinase
VTGRPLICVVDDDALERALIARVLGAAFPDASVREAGDTVAADEICARDEIDCVVLDYNLGASDGIAFAQHLRSVKPFLPIVMATHFGDEMLVARAVTSGVTDYIPKAKITPQSLRRAIEHAMQVAGQAAVIDQQRAELENFAYALAHDFKQPIRQIRTFSALIAEAVGGGEVGGVEQHLAFLTAAASRLGDLVDVMSQYTLLNQTPEIGDVSLDRVIENVRASLAPYLLERGGALKVAPLPQVRGNETLMAQVLQNLVVNGFKYNTSKAPLVEISADVQKTHCAVSVKDNGIGIDAKYRDEIFKPLQRLHTNAEYSGTGLGLTLARKALAVQGGSIRCESALGRGSTFIVRLPLARAAAPAA